MRTLIYSALKFRLRQIKRLPCNQVRESEYISVSLTRLQQIDWLLSKTLLPQLFAQLTPALGR
jgi:hypothetical protein